MRKSEFIEFVRSPENLSCEKTVELQKLVKDFPWFQTAQVLLCRNLNVCENMGFEKQLRIAAAYSTDRARLHQLVMERVALTENEVKDAKDLKEVVQKADDQETEKSTQQDDIKSKKATEKPKIQISTIEKASEKTETPLSPEDDFLNKQILSHAISSSNLLQHEEEENPIPAPIDFDEHIKLPNEPIDKSKIEQKKVVEPKDDFDENSPHSFTEWLKHVDDFGKSNKDDEAEDNDDEFTFESKADLSAIKSDQNIPKKKTSFYNPTEMAKLSVKEDDDLISETLARIYAQQGNYEKAIHAYKKLSLKYPEKKIYFANQIKTLEENLNP